MKKLAVAVAAVVMTACGPMTQQEQIAAMTGTASAGQTLYSTTCASCHGANGKGTASGVDLFEPMANDPATEIIETVLNGKTGTSMAAYKTVLTNQQIASRLSVTLHTVKNHVHSLLGKLSVGSRAEAVAVFRAAKFRNPD